jgi:hypothetical protein
VRACVRMRCVCVSVSAAPFPIKAPKASAVTCIYTPSPTFNEGMMYERWGYEK